MININKKTVLISAIIIVLFQSAMASAMLINEVVSIEIGKRFNNIGNQFVAFALEPYNGFAVDSKGNILISDSVKSRILRFIDKTKLFDTFTPEHTHPFSPGRICLDENDIIYAHNTSNHEILVFSQKGAILRSFNPANSVFEHKHKNVPIMTISCSKRTIEIVYGVNESKMIHPVYQDEYDQDFKLKNRRIFDDEVAYYSELRGIEKKFEKHFEDAKGNSYGYPIVNNWYGKFLPLQKYSAGGSLLSTLDSVLLKKHTKYKIYDYYTGRNKLGLGLSDNIGKDFMIVNWYVTPSGVVYVLLANNDYVKVLRIEE